MRASSGGAEHAIQNFWDSHWDSDRSLMKAFLLTAGFSYLLGSIPFGYILMFVFHGQDVRKTGSGNIGATNVARSSPTLGFLTLVLDALKGLAAVSITRAAFPGHGVLAGVAAL